MSRNLELPEEVFQALEKVAQANGVSPAEWIVGQLPSGYAPREERPLSEAMRSFIGVIDSSEEPHTGYPDTAFTKGLVEKYEKQGLKFTKKS